MNDDLILRQAVLDALRTWDQGKTYLPIEFRELVEGLPSALETTMKLSSDAVEVVRCKDCKHRPEKVMHGYKGTARDWYLIFPDEECPCENFEDEWYSYMPKDDWFCPNGERKDNE